MSVLFAALPARAAEDGGPSIEGEISVVSDYRYRGYSLSHEDPALQGGASLTLPGGLYAGIWGSSIADYAGADVEIDFYAGWAGSAAGVDVDVGAMCYTYPDGEDVDYWEFPVSVARSWNAFTGAVGFVYAPEQDNLGGEDNRYLYIAGEWAPESWPVSLDASLGQEDGAFADGKLDWAAGVTAPFGPISLSLHYVDSDGPDAEAALVAGIKASF